MEREDENENSKFLSLSSSADLKRHEGGNETKLTDRYRKKSDKVLTSAKNHAKNCEEKITEYPDPKRVFQNARFKLGSAFKLFKNAP